MDRTSKPITEDEEEEDQLIPSEEYAIGVEDEPLLSQISPFHATRQL
jgi:hypothetical protein